MTNRRLGQVIKFFNKEYREDAAGPFLLEAQKNFISKILKAFNGGFPKHLFFGDDLFVCYRNLSLLGDERFVRAVEDTRASEVLMARLWRVYFVAWSMANRARYSDGYFLDLGCYNAETLEVALRYVRLLHGDVRLRVIAADLFENPPSDSLKSDHGPLLSTVVEKRLSKLCEAHILKGCLPDSLNELPPLKISWAHIDLNGAEADSRTFEALIPFLNPGAHVIFDDYGFFRYRDSKLAVDYLIESLKLPPVVELPTGQGLYIH